MENSKIIINMPHVLRDGMNERCMRRGQTKSEYMRELVRADLIRAGLLGEA